MTWKKLHEQIAGSRKFPALTDIAFRTWVHILPCTDSAGRFYADPLLVKNQAMPRYPYRLDQVEAALAELNRQRLIHLYDRNGERWLVLHDNPVWNEQDAAAKKAKPLYPEPPLALCPCLKQANGRSPHDPAPPSISSDLSGSSPSSEGGSGETESDNPDDVRRALKLALDVAVKVDSFEAWETYLVQVARKQTHCTAAPDTLRRAVRGMIRRPDVGPRKLEAYLLSPDAAGRHTNDWEAYFRDQGESAMDALAKFTKGDKP